MATVDRNMYACWEVWCREQCVAHLATFAGAVAACRNGTRSLTIYDPEGRIVTCYSSGVEV